MPRTVRSPYDENKDWLDDSRQEAASGGSGILHQATVTLDNDQIKTLPDAAGAVEIVPAPGSNKIIHFLSGAYVFDCTAGAYSSSGGNPSSWSLQLNGVEIISSLVTTPTLATGISYGFWTYGMQPNPDGYLQLGGGSFGSGDVIDKALSIQDYYSPGTNYTNGHADNTLVVSVAYMIFNALTGEFE